MYRIIGVTPLMIRGSRVLEVAPGSGQNSLHVARCQPGTYTLVEPNPTAIQDITRTYQQNPAPITPTLIRSKLQDFQPQELYDIVICENWLGCSAEERALLRKLGGFRQPEWGC